MSFFLKLPSPNNFHSVCKNHALTGLFPTTACCGQDKLLSVNHLLLQESDDDKEVFDSDSNYTPSPRTKRSLDAADAVMKELRADTQYSVYNSDDDFVSPSPNEKKTSTKVKKKLKVIAVYG